MSNLQFLRLVQINLNTVLIPALLIAAFCDLLPKKNEIESGEINVHFMNKSLLRNYPQDEEIKNTKKLVCFYVFTKDFNPDIMSGLCTHINVGFFEINNENNSLKVSSEQEEMLSQITLLKERDKNLKIIISVGGAGVVGFSSMVMNHTTRKMFIRSCMEVIKRHKIDGIDIDWEWPVLKNGNMKEKLKFVQLLHEIRKEFNRHKKKYILSADVSSTPALIELAYYVNYIGDAVDFVNVMCYDYHYYTKLHPFTGHNAPLYSVDRFIPMNINNSIHFWILNSMPREKIVVGVPTYGHTFQLLNSNKHSLVAPAKGFGSIGDSGFANYNEICEFIKLKNTTVVYDSVSKVPYTYKFPEWISFDDEGSLAIKASYILKENLGGAMVFSANADDFSGSCKGDKVPFPLIRRIRNILLNEV